MVNVSGFNEPYYFHPQMEQRLEAPASSFLAVNPFAADENFGDAAIGWVMQRKPGTAGTASSACCRSDVRPAPGTVR